MEPIVLATMKLYDFDREHFCLSEYFLNEVSESTGVRVEEARIIGNIIQEKRLGILNEKA